MLSGAACRAASRTAPGSARRRRRRERAGGGGLAPSLSRRLGRVGDAEREMSDFDSNPFADPDLNNPFKVSVVPSISRRRDASLFV